MKELLNIANNNIVVFSTHSPFMIDKSNIGRHYIVKKSNEITSLTVSDNSNFAEEEVLFQAIGYTIFHDIKDKNILFEGYWDNLVFKIMKNDELDVGHIFMGGVKNAQAVSKIIELQNRDYIVISDSDRAAKDSKQEFNLTCTGQWIEYGDIVQGVYTLEDFVSNSRIKLAIKSLLKLKEFKAFEEIDLAFIDNLSNKKLDKITSAFYQIDNTLKKRVFQGKLKEKIFIDIKKSDISNDYNKLLEYLMEQFRN